MTASGVSTQVPIDVWIGVDDGYVHRVRITYETTANAESVSGEMTITMSDWGTDVSIGKPDAGEVFDVDRARRGARQILTGR